MIHRCESPAVGFSDIKLQVSPEIPFLSSFRDPKHNSTNFVCPQSRLSKRNSPRRSGHNRESHRHYLHESCKRNRSRTSSPEHGATPSGVVIQLMQPKSKTGPFIPTSENAAIDARGEVNNDTGWAAIEMWK
jgi:hypothetical protein